VKKLKKTYAVDPKVVEAVEKEALKTERSASYVVNKALSEKLIKNGSSN